MKNIYRLAQIFLSIFIIAILISSCEKDSATPKEERLRAFEAMNSASVFANKTVVYEFDENIHQIVYTADKRMYMVTNMEQTECYSLEISVIPVVGQEVDVTYKPVGIESQNDAIYSMIVLKEKGGKVWLWEEDKEIGFVLDFSN